MDKPAKDLDPAAVNHLLNLLAKLQTAAEQRRKTGALNQGAADAVVVTTSQDTAVQIERAVQFAREIDRPFVRRAQKSLPQLCAEQAAAGVVVVGTDRVTLQPAEGTKAFFHPNMARHRAEILAKNGEDVMLTAMGFTPGQQVLDCTFGLGSDALIASLHAGETGLVVGLEKSLLLSVLLRWGLREYPWLRLSRVGDSLAKASRRIKLYNLDHREVLEHLPDRSFDVVYFDPMFPRSVRCSNGIELVRSWGCQETLDKTVLQQAARVARHRVVVKVRKDSPELTKLGFDRLILGARRIGYGILEAR
jgi:hypothetical protein